MYALLMAAVFSLLLQFYLNRQTANNFSIKGKDKNAAKSQANEDETKSKKLKKKETSQEVRDDGKKD